MVAIFVALMFVSLVLLDLGLVKWRAWREPSRQVQGAKVPSFAAGLRGWCELPERIYLSPGHAWFRPDPTGRMEVGGDAFLAHAVGKVERIVLPKAGEQVKAGQPLFRLEVQGRSLEVSAAIGGQVLAVNSRLARHLEWLKTDPYHKGWICYLAPLSGDEKTLPCGQKATRWLEKEVNRLREFLSLRSTPDLALGLTSPDGGMPAVGCLRELDASAWAAFEAEFLRCH